MSKDGPRILWVRCNVLSSLGRAACLLYFINGRVWHRDTFASVNVARAFLENAGRRVHRFDVTRGWPPSDPCGPHYVHYHYRVAELRQLRPASIVREVSVVSLAPRRALCSPFPSEIDRWPPQNADFKDPDIVVFEIEDSLGSAAKQINIYKARYSQIINSVFAGYDNPVIIEFCVARA